MTANQFTSGSVKFLISNEMEKILPGDRTPARENRLALPLGQELSLPRSR